MPIEVQKERKVYKEGLEGKKVRALTCPSPPTKKGSVVH